MAITTMIFAAQNKHDLLPLLLTLVLSPVSSFLSYENAFKLLDSDGIPYEPSVNPFNPLGDSFSPFLESPSSICLIF